MNNGYWGEIFGWTTWKRGQIKGEPMVWSPRNQVLRGQMLPAAVRSPDQPERLEEWLEALSGGLMQQCAAALPMLHSSSVVWGEVRGGESAPLHNSKAQWWGIRLCDIIPKHNSYCTSQLNVSCGAAILPS